jgi:hypothetical protein
VLLAERVEERLSVLLEIDYMAPLDWMRRLRRREEKAVSGSPRWSLKIR